MESTLIPCGDEFGKVKTRVADGMVYVMPVCTCDADDDERRALIAHCEARLTKDGIA